MKPDKIHLSLALLMILTTISWIASCTHEANIADIPEICFKDVRLIYNNSCANSLLGNCHDGKGGSEASDLVLLTYENIRSSVVPGNPYASKSYKAIITTRGENKMPPNQPLSLENRTLIRLWIEKGASADSSNCPEIKGTTGGVDTYVNPRACFKRDILPVLVSRCATTGPGGCHDAQTHKEGYNFSIYSSIMTAVRAGNPGNSKLYQVIKFGSGEEKMPPSGSAQLSTAEIDSIGKWISYGALDENCGEVCDTINPVTFSGTIWPVMQTSCTGCHSGTSPSGNVTLGSYGNVATVASNGLLLNALKGTGVTRMPLAGSFSFCKIRQFEIWVNNKFLNN